ncbi:MAG: TolC family protein [Labilithrix sp.]|nr:TolC family protein [Labilithrix sp.]
MPVRTLVILILVLAWPATGFAQESAAGEPLRIQDAIRLALTNNERARKAPLRVEQAEGQLQRARSAFFPSLTAGASGTLRATEDRSGRNLTSNGTLTLSQPLIAPSAFPLYAQSSHQLESEKWSATQERRVVAFDTARSFLQVLTAERVLDAAVRRVERATANLQNADARAQAGLASTNDATRAQLDLATAQREVAQATGSAQRARTQLAFLVGKAVEGSLAAPDRTDQAAESFESAAHSQVQAALDRRPDVRAANERTEALRMNAKEPHYRLIPSLSLQGQVRVLPDPLPTERAHDETLTLNLSWNIFDAGQRYADRKTRLAVAESQALDEKLLRRSVQTDVDLAIIALRAAREAHRIALDQTAAAQKLSDETEILYRQGLARALELTDANARRFDAEVARAAAKLSMEQAYLELRFALGLGPLDEGLPQ